MSRKCNDRRGSCSRKACVSRSARGGLRCDAGPFAAREGGSCGHASAAAAPRRPALGGQEGRDAGQRPTILPLRSPGRQTPDRSLGARASCLFEAEAVVAQPHPRRPALYASQAHEAGRRGEVRPTEASISLRAAGTPPCRCTSVTPPTPPGGGSAEPEPL
jgi:hypothetical protein